METVAVAKVVPQPFVTEYVIVTTPTLTPVTIPVEGVTVAIEVLLLVHVPRGIVFDSDDKLPSQILIIPVIGVGCAFTVITKLDTTKEFTKKNIDKALFELEKLYKIKQNAKAQGAANIEDKVDKLIYDMKIEEKKLHLSRRVFYNRLKDLDLLEE